MKLIEIRFKNKSGSDVKMFVADDTIKRVIPRERLITIVTPLFKRGFKNQVVKLSETNFDFLMEQLNG